MGVFRSVDSPGASGHVVMGDLAVRYGTLLVIAAGIGGTIGTILSINPLAAPRTGLIGEVRVRALRKHQVFAIAEPVLLLLGAWIAMIPGAKARRFLSRQLALAGYWLGLLVDEALLLSLFSGLIAAIVGTTYAVRRGYPATSALLFFLVGVCAVFWHVQSIARKRNASIVRGLPAAMNLVTLAMSAGYDFPGALRLAITNQGTSDALNEELVTISRSLELGHTRQRALRNFAERVPIEAVQDFVAAVTLSEQKGTPLYEALLIQTAVLRDKRSTSAEEAASRIQGQLMIPVLVLTIALVIVCGAPAMLTLQVMSEKLTSGGF